ncbi:TonB-dependent siderophore receptor [Massilia sp. Root335]|uniref:TonB-dependent receptor plug domain-containing protein n=1 Tax=Massilia sp. Root335 TaxID=1736517 RepID=UPI0006F5DD93|nr:TonB-dependent receptor [Massilia sp. Root335]KQV41480.1 TonB-dependent vitamin B12 receptor [Massilia sp. Root335]
MSFPVSRQAAALSLAFAAAASAHADPIPDTVVVTANRTPQHVDDVIPDTVVVTSEEIARAGAGSVADVLRRQRGIEIGRNGGAGTNTTVFLRGANSNQVVVLVDGVRIGAATTGAAAWNALPLSSIDHIEIVYGPLSALYGADAIGGVVQIFTKQSGGRPAFSAGAGGGTYGTNQYDASVHGATGGEHDLTYALSGAREESDGFSATRPGAYGYNGDADGYTRNSVNGRVALRLAEGHEIGAQFLQSRLNAQYDSGSPAFDAHNIQEVDSYAVFLNDRVRPNWRSSVQLARSEDKLGSFTSTAPSGTSQLNTRQDEFTWQNTFDLDGDTLQVLAGHRKEQVLSSAVKDINRTRITNAVAAAYDLRRGRHLLDVSARTDRSEYGSKTTGAAGYGYEFTNDLRATASVGTSFRAPTFNELYYPNYGLSSNRPERGRNAEAGVQYRVAGVDLQANYYRNRLTDMIVSVTPCPGHPGGSCAYNVDHALLEGLTLAASARLGNLDLRASADLQDPRDDTTGKQLARRARRHASVAADYSVGQVDAGVELQASGRRFDDAANANRLGGYGLLNLYTTWHMTRDWSLLVRVDNAADKAYELARNYGTAGRTWFAGFRYASR